MVPYHDIIKVVIKSDFESTLIKLMGQTCLIKHRVNKVIYYIFFIRLNMSLNSSVYNIGVSEPTTIQADSFVIW